MTHPSIRHLRPRTLSQLTLLLSLLLSAHGALAMSLVSLSEEQLIEEAIVILHAVVLETDTAQRNRPVPIVTEVVLGVVEVLKGSVDGPSVVVQVPGGSTATRALSVSGTPHFSPGEEVCVFLRRVSDQSYILTGMGQGKYHLEENPDTGLTLAVRDGSIAELQVRPNPGQTLRQALESRPPSLQFWDTFRRRIVDRVRLGGNNH